MADDASRDCRVHIIEAKLYVQYVKLSDAIEEYLTDLISYNSLLSSHTCSYEDTFRGTRNIKFELEECSMLNYQTECL